MAQLKRRDLFPFFIDTKKLNIVDGKKYCSTCQRWLTLDKYKVNKAKYIGLDYWCEECMSKHKH